MSIVELAAVAMLSLSAQDPAYAFALSRLAGPDLRYTPVGVFRSVRRTSYDELVRGQVSKAKEKSSGDPEQDLTALLNSGDTWTIL